jgi:hypothetical protein
LIREELKFNEEVRRKVSLIKWDKIFLAL